MVGTRRGQRRREWKLWFSLRGLGFRTLEYQGLGLGFRVWGLG